MIDLSKFLDNEGLSDSEKKYYNENHYLIEESFIKCMDKLVIENNIETLEVIIRIYQLFTYNDENKIGKFTREKIYNFYIKNIETFIINRNDWIIYMLMDLFYCDPLLFPNENNNDIFLEKSYPILLLSTTDMSSHIAIASFRLIAIIESENNVYYLKKYIHQNPKGNYIEDIQEALENINE